MKKKKYWPSEAEIAAEKKRLDQLWRKRQRQLERDRRVPDTQYCITCGRVAGRVHRASCASKDNSNLGAY
jgi:hypothetical protein